MDITNGQALGLGLVCTVLMWTIAIAKGANTRRTIGVILSLFILTTMSASEIQTMQTRPIMPANSGNVTYHTGYVRHAREPQNEPTVILKNSGVIPADEYPDVYQGLRDHLYRLGQAFGHRADYFFHRVHNNGHGEGWVRERRYNARGQVIFDSGKEYAGPLKVVMHHTQAGHNAHNQGMFDDRSSAGR